MTGQAIRFDLPSEVEEHAKTGTKFLYCVKMGEGEENRLLVVGKNVFYHVAISDVQGDSHFEPTGFEFDPKVVKIKTEGEIAQVAVGPQMAAVLTKAGEIWLYPILSNRIDSPQKLPLPIEGVFAVPSDLRLSFSPDGKELHAQSPTTFYTWKFVVEKRDFAAELKSKLDDLQKRPLERAFLERLLGSLVDRETALKEVRAEMAQRGRLAEFDALVAQFSQTAVATEEPTSATRENFRKAYEYLEFLRRSKQQTETSL
jgi:hypothetical protein